MTSPPIHTKQAIEHIVREDWGQILAILVKQLRDFQLAEDSLQDAVEAALKHWPERGIPENPKAWLLQTARRKAIDRIRRHRNFESKQPEYALLMEQERQDFEMNDEAIPDERLRMIFTCCHPALDEKSRVALTLRTLGGLTTDEIAASFLDKEKAMAQRLVRAKRKIRDAGIAYQIPESEFWSDRLNSVLSVLYLIFNEGYSPSAGDRLIRFDLCEEAIRLTRAIANLLPDEAEIMGLLALMLLHHARSKTRFENNCLIPLEQQNRSQWSQTAIEEGTTLVKQALKANALGPYQLQAAISAVHSEAESYAKTDWHQIVLLYEELHHLQPSPIIRLNQAMAISYAGSVADALEWINTRDISETLQSYQPFHATMADLHMRNDNNEAAISAFRRAIELSENQPEKAFLKSRLNKLLH